MPGGIHFLDIMKTKIQDGYYWIKETGQYNWEIALVNLDKARYIVTVLAEDISFLGKIKDNYIYNIQKCGVTKDYVLGPRIEYPNI